MAEQKDPEKQGDHDIRVKTAGVVTGVNVALTAIKFILYYLSGSMAVLAESWHSFADIATSLLVFVALFKANPHWLPAAPASI